MELYYCFEENLTRWVIRVWSELDKAGWILKEWNKKPSKKTIDETIELLQCSLKIILELQKQKIEKEHNCTLNYKTLFR
jgi:hypothetical protein